MGESKTFTDNFVTAKEFADILGVKKTCFYKMYNDGKLPLPISIFTRRKIWKRTIITEFIEQLA